MIQDPTLMRNILTTCRHAQGIGGARGVSFQIGDSTRFVTDQDHRLFMMHPPVRDLLLLGELVASAVAETLLEDVIVPLVVAMAADLEALL